MRQRFDAIISDAQTGDAPGHYEISPAEFGAEQDRLGMFRDCLRVLVDRYPSVSIAVGGSHAALQQMGLAPGEMQIGDRVISIMLQPTDAADRLRLLFSRR